MPEAAVGRPTFTTNALPSLRGVSWWSFLAIWAAVLILCITGAVMVARQRIDAPSITRPALLFGMYLSDKQANMVQFPLGVEAVHSGLRSGDRVVAVNGHSVAPSEEAISDALGSEGRFAVVETISSDGVHRRHRLTSDPAHMDQALASAGFTNRSLKRTDYVISYLTTVVAPISLAILLLVCRRHEPLAPWISLLALLTVLGVGAPAALAETDPTIWRPIDVLALPACGWMQIGVLTLFPDGRFKPWWTWLVLIGTLPLVWFMTIDRSPEVYNAAVVAGLVAAAGVVMARYRDMPPGVGRQQIRWALFGFVAAMTLSAIDVAIPVAIDRASSVRTTAWLIVTDSLVNGLANATLLTALTVGVMRYRLYDADATISRSFAYATLTVCLLIVFAGSEKLIDVIGQQYFGGKLGAAASGTAAALAAAMIAPIHHRLKGWAEARFRGSLVALRNGLPLLVNDMRETASPAALADAVLSRVAAGVHASRGALVLQSGLLRTRDVPEAEAARWMTTWQPPVGDRLECDRRDHLFPFRAPLKADGLGQVGWLLVGLRPDGSSYGKEEQAALIHILDPVARALCIAVERERRQSEQAQHADSLRGQIRSLWQAINTVRLKLELEASSEENPTSLLR